MKNFEEINRALVAKKKYRSKSPMIMLLSALILFAVVLAAQSCKAWRTISTTSTYTQQDDSTKTTTTISTKTVEEYQGHKK